MREAPRLQLLCLARLKTRAWIETDPPQNQCVFIVVSPGLKPGRGLKLFPLTLLAKPTPSRPA
ncbi:hypothetical protein THIARS_80245 [Thiomonas delicata]|uniref:Uncharacterized protein n=1 Tax=Thiomonas delicata TaxID=364030 RepID=A0A238D919_THIDL|nr:hypothetical protein THIARS_80245 [Thiomonas delicata]